MSKIYVIGDLHGQYDKYVHLLRDAGLVDDQLHWAAGDTRLWIAGDFVDRGPDGIGCIELTMRLQQEAAVNDGEVGAVIGNHDISLLSAYIMPHEPSTGPEETFYEDWLRFGNPDDLERMTDKHVDWLINLPAMVMLDHHLLIHADAALYYEYGESVDTVNKSFRDILAHEEPAEWDRFLEGFSEHDYFWDHGTVTAQEFLLLFGGQKIVHGHTPLDKWLNRDAEEIIEACYYADGLCVNVDGGMYRGSPGFYVILSPLED